MSPSVFAVLASWTSVKVDGWDCPGTEELFMSYLPAVEVLDLDGAIREAAESVDSATRASFLRKIGIGVGAVAAGSAFAGVVPRGATAATPASDVSLRVFLCIGVG